MKNFTVLLNCEYFSSTCTWQLYLRNREEKRGKFSRRIVYHLPECCVCICQLCHDVRKNKETESVTRNATLTTSSCSLFILCKNKTRLLTCCGLYLCALVWSLLALPTLYIYIPFLSLLYFTIPVHCHLQLSSVLPLHSPFLKVYTPSQFVPYSHTHNSVSSCTSSQNYIHP